MDALQDAEHRESELVAEVIRERIARHVAARGNEDGLVATPLPGVRMMCTREAARPLRSVYKPLVCIVLQGRKELRIGAESATVGSGQAVLVGVDAPVLGTVLQASRDRPYLALAIELDMKVLHELSASGPVARDVPPTAAGSPFQVDTTRPEVLGCARRLLHLLDHEEAVPMLFPALSLELHHWLLRQRFGAELRMRCTPEGLPRRIAQAVKVLREDFRHPISVDRLTEIACMSPSTFFRRFKEQTSLTPLQFQKQLRLVEARRLMMATGYSATHAALEVGYESVPQFTREYARLFGASPSRETRRARQGAFAQAPRRTA